MCNLLFEVKFGIRGFLIFDIGLLEGNIFLLFCLEFFFLFFIEIVLF